MSIWGSGSGGGGGGGTWGSITGTLSAQTDLQNALNTKTNIADIINNLTSTDINKPLSANQGKILNDSHLELLSNTFTFKHKVKNKIDNLYAYSADVILTTTGSTDLQTAINNLTEGQILEIQTDATYDPIVIPTTKKIIIRGGIGWLPKLTGSRCIRLSNGCEDVLISGLIIENADNTGGNNNYTGTAITFNEHQAIVNDIIFHNISIKNTTLGSSVMLSYHWSVSGDLYYNPPQLSELSDNIAFVGCNLYKACLDGNEGACISLRAVKNAYLADNFIDNTNNVGRGIQIQGALSVLVEKNKIFNIGGSNAEAIKIDQIGTSPFMQTAIIDGNYLDTNIEGIDIDDVVRAIVTNNICLNSSNEGLSLDNDSKLIALNNTIFNCLYGIRFESGSEGYLANNNVFNCYGQNYLMENSYVPDASNKSDPSLYNNNDFYKYEKDLTEATLTNIVDVYIPNNRGISINLKYSIEAINSSTNVVELHYGEFIVTARNQNGTIDNESLHPVTLEVDHPTGSGITDTWGVVNGSGKITINLTATSGITPTGLKIFYEIKVLGGSGFVRL